MKAPGTNLQAPEKLQAASFNGWCAPVDFGAWNLELLWCLELEIWSFVDA